MYINNEVKFIIQRQNYLDKLIKLKDKDIIKIVTGIRRCGKSTIFDRFDVKGKKALASEYKYYAVDMGFRNYLLGKKASQDMGHMLENIVYLELLRMGYKVYTGKVDELEIDFVAENENGLEYYQVSLSVRDENTLERELKSLQKTGDFYPKYLLTMDNDLDADYNGIKKINIINWLC